MFEWARRFFTDETAFVGIVRAAVLGAGGFATTGALPGPDWLGPVLLAAGGMIRAGDKNPKG